MNNYKINEYKTAFNQLLKTNEFTFALTLKPNAPRASGAGPVYRITTENQKYQIVAGHKNIHANFNEQIFYYHDKTLFSKLNKFQMRLDRSLVGRRFNEDKNKHLRTKIISIAEGRGVSGHLHCALKIHESRLPKFEEMISGTSRSSEIGQIWNKISIGGTVHIEEIFNPAGWASYISKSLYGDEFSDRITILT